MSLIDQFCTLFQGRRDAVGGEEGRAVRVDPTVGWRDAIVHHVTRGPAVGVYPMILDGTEDRIVHWGCVDFDIKSEGHAKFDYETEAEAHTAARNLVRALVAFRMVAWIERTRSHGRHVWVFVDQPVTAAKMRHALLVACEVAGVSTREVNPKSDGRHLGVEQLGNYVRLPYPGNAAEGERAIFEDEEAWTYMKRQDFVTCALENRTSHATVMGVAALWRPPAPTVDLSFLSSDLDDEKDVPKVVKEVIEAGPQYGDRSAGLVYVAARCKEHGLSPDRALQVVAIADEAWGKYVGRSDREQRLREVVERGWR